MHMCTYTCMYATYKHVWSPLNSSNVLSQEELEKKLMEQMTERLQATEAQLKEEMHTKVWSS